MKVVSCATEVQEEKTCETIKAGMSCCKISITGANEISADANENLQIALALKKIDRNLVQQAQLKIEIGIDRERKLDETLVSEKKKSGYFVLYIILLRCCFL